MTENLKQKWLRLHAVAQQIGVMQPWDDFSESDKFTYIWKDKTILRKPRVRNMLMTSFKKRT